MGGTLAAGGPIYQQLSAPFTHDQQTVVTSTTRVVVVLIPGFPVESIALGSLLGFMILIVLRRRKQTSAPPHRSGRNVSMTKPIPGDKRPSERGFP